MIEKKRKFTWINRSGDLFKDCLGIYPHIATKNHVFKKKKIDISVTKSVETKVVVNKNGSIFSSESMRNVIRPLSLNPLDSCVTLDMEMQ